MLWFDAHLDLAAVAVCGRDMLAPLERLREANAGPWPPPGVCLPSLAEGGVRLALATVFLEPIDPAAPPAHSWACQYAKDDAEQAARLGRAQIEVYRTWRDAGRVAIDLRSLLRRDRGVGQLRGGMGVSELVPADLEHRLDAVDRGRRPAAKGAPLPRLHIGILIENADSIRGPDELGWWVEQGVVAIGLAWARASRYAAGNGTPADQDHGLTPLGREMVAAMDARSVAHDLSHLSDRGMDELLGLTDRPVMASHSNCRALFGGAGAKDQRHLRDESIREIGRRGGVVGLNLYQKFLRDPPAGGWSATPAGGGRARATIGDAVRHVEHVCEVMGHRRGVGLGSDMDGGFSSLEMCEGIESPSGLGRLAEALAERGWSEPELRGFAHGNWARFFGEAMAPR